MTLNSIRKARQLTKTELRVIQCAEKIEAISAKKANCLTFFPSDYICALPHSSSTASFYEHNDGRKKITLSVPSPDFELPYGAIPRLLITKLAQLAKIQKTRQLTLPRISQFCKELALPVTGGRIAQVKKQVLALFGVNFLITTHTNAATFSGEKFSFIDNWEGWAKSTKNGTDWTINVTLSEIFFTQICQHAFPIDCRALWALSRSMAMDIYVWLIYRMNAVKTPTVINWTLLQKQFGQGYDTQSKYCKYKFKKSFTENFRLVLVLLPNATISCDSKQGLRL